MAPDCAAYRLHLFGIHAQLHAAERRHGSPDRAAAESGAAKEPSAGAACAGRGARRPL